MDLTFNTTDILKGGKHRDEFQDIIVLYGPQVVEHNRTENLSALVDIPQGEYTINQALELVHNDVLIEHWPVGIKAPIEILEVEVPNELPNNIIIDEKENEVKQKFKSWGNQPMFSGSTTVVLRCNIGGNSLDSDYWKLFDDPNSNVRKSIDKQLPNHDIEILGPIEIGQFKAELNNQDEI